jgi:choline dehydrogenase-like flavoprotein
MSLLRILQSPAQPQADLKRVYDAIVIGSGAAGGMAAHVLTSQGMKVLMLEAGKKLDIDKELKSMEWPFQHPRRGGMPPDHHALTLNEYTIRQPPYAAGLKHSKVFSYVSARGASAGKPTSGAGSRCVCPTTTSRPERTTATVKTGRSLTRTSPRITTGSTSISASRA